MSRTRAGDLHRRWMKDAKDRREYEALRGGVFHRGRYDRGPESCRHDSATGRAANEDDSGRSREAGERREQAVHPNSGAIRSGDREPLTNPLRAGIGSDLVSQVALEVLWLKLQ
jgi:hypothetical protein